MSLSTSLCRLVRSPFCAKSPIMVNSSRVRNSPSDAVFMFAACTEIFMLDFGDDSFSCAVLKLHLWSCNNSFGFKASPIGREPRFRHLNHVMKGSLVYDRYYV